MWGYTRHATSTLTIEFISTIDDTTGTTWPGTSSLDSHWRSRYVPPEPPQLLACPHWYASLAKGYVPALWAHRVLPPRPPPAPTLPRVASRRVRLAKARAPDRSRRRRQRRALEARL